VLGDAMSEPDRDQGPVPKHEQVDPVAEQSVARTARTAEEPTADPSQPVPADAVWVTVLVVDQDTQRPVPGADVAWIDDTWWRRLSSFTRDEASALQNDFERMAGVLGWHARTFSKAPCACTWAAVNHGIRAARHSVRQRDLRRHHRTTGRRLPHRTARGPCLAGPGARQPRPPCAARAHEIARYAADGTYLRPWSRGYLRNTDQDGRRGCFHVQEHQWDDGLSRPDRAPVALHTKIRPCRIRRRPSIRTHCRRTRSCCTCRRRAASTRK
jgi:hypothetical protein